MLRRLLVFGICAVLLIVLGYAAIIAQQSRMNDIARAVARESIRTMPADTAEASRYVQNQLALAGFDVDGLSVSVTTEEPDVVRLNLTYPVRLGPLAVGTAKSTILMRHR